MLVEVVHVESLSRLRIVRDSVFDAETREASMWTAANRKSYERKGLRYPSDMTDA